MSVGEVLCWVSGWFLGLVGILLGFRLQFICEFLELSVIIRIFVGSLRGKRL